MGISEILAALEAEGEKKEEEILAEARQQAAEAEAIARLEAKEKRERELKNREALAELERTRKVTAAKLEAKRKKLQAVANLTQEVLDEAGRRLGGLRNGPDYERIFEALASEICDPGFEAGVAEVDRSDKEVAAKVLPRVGFQGEIKPDLKSHGGLILTAADRKVVADNRFEGRLKRSEEFLRGKISRWLFGEGGA